MLARLCAGLTGLTGLSVAAPVASALAAARRRVGVAPLRALFDLLSGPAAGLSRTGVYWHGLLVCAVDATMMCCPHTAANLAVYRRGGGNHGGTGYPMLRLLALVACGTRTVIAATSGTDRVGETGYVGDLRGALRAGMIVLADRNFGYAPTVATVAGTGADLLFRVKARQGASCRSCAACPTGRGSPGWVGPRSG